MPGRFFLRRPLTEISYDGFCAADLGEEPPRVNISPGQEIVTLTAQGFLRMRWGIIPVGRVNARGRPVMETIVNARSETLFDKSAFEGRTALSFRWMGGTNGPAKSGAKQYGTSGTRLPRCFGLLRFGTFGGRPAGWSWHR